MDFITIPLVVGIITLGIYGLFELFARRKERLAIIERLGAPQQVPNFLNQFSLPGLGSNGSFGTLKIASLLLGVGLGLLAGFFIGVFWLDELPQAGASEWHIREASGVIYGASVMLFGGLGLLMAFLLEQKFVRKQKS